MGRGERGVEVRLEVIIAEVRKSGGFEERGLCLLENASMCSKIRGNKSNKSLFCQIRLY